MERLQSPLGVAVHPLTMNHTVVRAVRPAAACARGGAPSRDLLTATKWCKRVRVSHGHWGGRVHNGHGGCLGAMNSCGCGVP